MKFILQKKSTRSNLFTIPIVIISADVKNDVFARITEPSNDYYDNDVSDNCDHKFGTFDDFGVTNDQKVSHNMLLMSKYKGQHGGKMVNKFGQGPPPLFGQWLKEKFFLIRDVPLTRVLHSDLIPICP